MGWPALPLDFGLSPEWHALVKQTWCKQRLHGFVHWGWLSRATAKTDGERETCSRAKSPSHLTPSYSQPTLDTWACSPTISRTSVTPDTWAKNTYRCAPLMFCNCYVASHYVAKITDTSSIKNTDWIWLTYFLLTVITTGKSGQTWPPKTAKYRQNIIDSTKKELQKYLGDAWSDWSTPNYCRTTYNFKVYGKINEQIDKQASKIILKTMRHSDSSTCDLLYGCLETQETVLFFQHKNIIYIQWVVTRSICTVRSNST